MIDNFAQQMSDRNRVIAAMKSARFPGRLRLRAVGDGGPGDVVLPACTYFEKTDLLSSNNFYLQYMPKIIDPLFESKSDLDAIRMVADKMGVGKYFGKSPEEYLKRSCTSAIPRPTRRSKGLTWEQVTTEAVHLNTDPMPYVPFFNQQYPDKERQDRVLRRDAGPLRPGALRSQGADRGLPGNPLFKKYPLVFLRRIRGSARIRSTSTSRG